MHFFDVVLAGLALLSAVYTADDNIIELLPHGLEITKPEGESVGMTCKTVVQNQKLLSNVRWIDPKNQTIDAAYMLQNNRYSLENSTPGQIMLLITTVREKDAGKYTCMAEYNEKTMAVAKSLIVFKPINWLDAPSEQSAILGSMYKIMCKVEASPSAQVGWSHKGVKVTRSNSRYRVEVDGLAIDGVQESDDGEYTCEAIVSETGEFKIRTINFEVVSPPKILSILPDPVEVIENEPATIECRAAGKPKPIISWIGKDGANITTGYDGTLYFTKVTKKDGGNYKCVAVNKANQAEKSVKINVISKPEIIESVNATIAVGQAGQLQCYVEGYPKPDIIIRKKDESRQNSRSNEQPKILVVEDPKKRPNTFLASLKFNRVQRSDDGLYECVAVNSVGDKHAETIGILHLTVQFSPIFDNYFDVKEVFTWEKNPVNLTCVADAIPNATISWFYGSNPQPIDTNPSLKYKIVSSGARSDLIVTPTPAKDMYGTYKCRATNQLGYAERKIDLKEAFAPGAFDAVTVADVTATSITFRFADQTHVGGLPVKGYVAQYMRGETADWNRAKNKTWPNNGPYVLSDLEPSTDYTFRFAIMNEIGAGPFGVSISQKTPVVSSPSEPLLSNPLQPNEKYIKSESANQITLRWNIPANNGADIDKYIVKYCPAIPDDTLSDGFFVSEDKCDIQEILYNNIISSHVIDKLNANSYYRVELTAHNSIGYGQSCRRFFLTNDVDEIRSTDSANNDGEKMPNTGMTSAVIIYIVVALLIALLVIIDIFCFFVGKTGVFYVLCGRCCGRKKKNDDKLGSESKDLISNGHKKIDIEEQSPMITDGTKRDTAIEYDLKKGTSKTGFVGKDSAV